MTLRAATEETSFSLVYSAEIVILVEVQVNSFRIQHFELWGDYEEMQFNLEQAKYLREQDSIRMAVYRNKMS